MNLLSLEVAAVIIVACALTHTIPAGGRPPFLLLASYGLYLWFAPRFFPVLLLVTAVAAVAGARAARGPAGSRAWMIGGVGLCLAALVALRLTHDSPGFAVPFAVIGLSFYTLQAISYIIDRYNRTLSRSLGLVELALFLAYFPKIAAGPIERAAPFAAQLRRPGTVDDVVLGRAATLIAVGLTRKLAIADPLMRNLEDAGTRGAVDSANLILRFVFALYNDFAGYTEIVRGVSLLFGIELSSNFAQPFFACSFTDLWNRWHMTLSHWLRDYVFLPLSRSLLRRNPAMRDPTNVALPPMVTMLASGLWHGASPHMMVWGAINGLYLIAERALSLARRPVPGAKARARIASRLAVFFLTAFAFLFFHLPVERAVDSLVLLFTGPIGRAPGAELALLAVFSLWLDSMQARRGDQHTFDHWPRVLRAAALAFAMLLWFLLTREAAPEPFVYQGF